MDDLATAGSAILLVEDEAQIARIEQWQLEEAGYRVTQVARGDDALAAVGSQQFDVAVLDFRLGDGQTGLDVYAEMRAAGHDLPVILVTAFDDPETAIAALRAGVRDFIPKSAEFLDYLPRAVDRVLTHERTRQQLAGEQAERARLEGALLTARAMQHHLSNQLAVTVGYAELLSIDPRLPSDLREKTLAALRGAEEAARLVAELQQITRVIPAQPNGRPVMLDVRESIADTWPASPG